MYLFYLLSIDFWVVSSEYGLYSVSQNAPVHIFGTYIYVFLLNIPRSEIAGSKRVKIYIKDDFFSSSQE
jgi:hypothetical protein